LNKKSEEQLQTVLQIFFVKVNQLTLPHKEVGFNQQRLPNSTNLHTHGLHISSQVNMNAVFPAEGLNLRT